MDWQTSTGWSFSVENLKWWVMELLSFRKFPKQRWNLRRGRRSGSGCTGMSSHRMIRLLPDPDKTHSRSCSKLIVSHFMIRHWPGLYCCHMLGTDRVFVHHQTRRGWGSLQLHWGSHCHGWLRVNLQVHMENIRNTCPCNVCIPPGVYVWMYTKNNNITCYCYVTATIYGVSNIYRYIIALWSEVLL